MIAMMFCVSCTKDAPLVKGERTDEVDEGIQTTDEQTDVGDGAHDVQNNETNVDDGILDDTEETPTTLTDYDTSTLSNKKHSWYFNKGTNHEQPRIDTSLKNVVDKYDAIYLESPDEKTIYLTFDEGYENGYTGQILDTLKEKNVKAVFFITGPYLSKNEDLVRRMVEEGHTVGNHTVNHPSMPDVDDEKLEKELLDLDRKFYELFGQSMKYVRPPMGEFSERTVALSKNLGYTSVFWSFAYRDWETNNQKGTDYAKETVLNAIHPGEVMLLHAVSVDNANALGDIIDEARSMGYEFGELQSLER
ncbi:MAG: delta-lactam-biosynthetic de-N-acetylase [Clostridiales bacterium]|nr:delta-lactam-biosynthetic de-N-acetylase [Clostridiales bacterium]